MFKFILRRKIKILKKISTTSRQQSHYNNDCTPRGVAKKAISVYKKSDVKNPIKTENMAVDFVLGKVPVIKAWNNGYNLGKIGFIAQQTYNETCKKRK